MTVFINIVRTLILLLNLHLPNKGKLTEIPEVIGIQREQNKEKKKEQQKILLQKPWKRTRYRKKRLLRHQKSTRSKDVRFSNQQKLRRMYRNC